MADIHIEEFYRDAAITLVQLYNAFPRRVNLFVEDIAGEDDPDEFGLHSRRHMACFGTLLWLAEEGYLRYVDTIRQEALDQAVLTQSAFVRLSAPAPRDLAVAISPDSMKQAESAPSSVQQDFYSHVHLIREALRSGRSTLITQAMTGTFFAPAASIK